MRMFSDVVIFDMKVYSVIIVCLCIYHMGWLRFVGSLKAQVSFAKEPYKRDIILQKRPTILRSLLIVATPQSCLTNWRSCARHDSFCRWTYWNLGLFCRILSLLQGSFAKETYACRETTDRSHPIVLSHESAVVCETWIPVMCHT